MQQQPMQPVDPRFAQQYPQQAYQGQPYPPRYPAYQGQMPVEPPHQLAQQAVGTQYQSWKAPVLHTIRPWVQYGLNEAQKTSVPHAMTEVAAIAYLLGKGVDPQTAHYIVESWEKGEGF